LNYTRWRRCTNVERKRTNFLFRQILCLTKVIAP